MNDIFTADIDDPRLFGKCCCDPDEVKDIIACLCELKQTIECVLECFDDHSHGIKERIILCILLDEIRKIEAKLDNPKFGLQEIKNEIIEINDIVSNSIFGLREIKNEVIDIENLLTNEFFGLNEIKNEIIELNDLLNNTTIGVPEIKNEIRFIENTVISINNTVNNRLVGLNEIKNEIIDINEVVTVINQTLNQCLNTPAGFAPVLTTGPVIARENANNVVVKVLNNTPGNQTVRIRIFNLNECPKCNNQVFNNTLGPIPPACACEVFASLNLPGQGEVTQYEVEVSGLVPGVYVWSSAFPGGNFQQSIEVNTFSHADFVPQIFNLC